MGLQICTHPSEDQRYEQANKYRTTEVENLLGFPSNYYLWRVVFCGNCKTILEKIGDVPERYNK